MNGNMTLEQISDQLRSLHKSTEVSDALADLGKVIEERFDNQEKTFRAELEKLQTQLNKRSVHRMVIMTIVYFAGILTTVLVEVYAVISYITTENPPPSEFWSTPGNIIAPSFAIFITFLIYFAKTDLFSVNVTGKE